MQSLGIDKGLDFVPLIVTLEFCPQLELEPAQPLE